MPLPELTGRVEKPTEIDIEQMRIEIADLKEALEDARDEASQLREATLHLSMLLGPVYRALQSAMGELGSPAGGTPRHPEAPGDRSSEFWDKWKQKLGGKSAEIIDVLIGHPGMTTESVRIAASCGFSTASTLLNKLKDMNLVRKDGGRWVLKSL